VEKATGLAQQNVAAGAVIDAKIYPTRYSTAEKVLS